MEDGQLPSNTTTDISLAKAQKGIPYEGLGIGYGDGVIDNERFGMKRFVYFDRILNSSIFGDPWPNLFTNLLRSVAILMIILVDLIMKIMVGHLFWV